jgi:hypothetical protein
METKMNDKEIIIDNAYSYWNGMKYIYRQCENINYYIPPAYGTSGNGEPHRCGGDSMYIITYKTIYGTEITKHFCESCFKTWIKDANDKGYKIIDMRGIK